MSLNDMAKQEQLDELMQWVSNDPILIEFFHARASNNRIEMRNIRNRLYSSEGRRKILSEPTRIRLSNILNAIDKDDAQYWLVQIEDYNRSKAVL